MKQRAVEKYYSVSETAFLLGFSPGWVREKFCDPPRERVVRIDDDYRIPASTINAFLEAHQVRSVEQAMDEAGIFARSGTELQRKVAAGRKGGNEQPG
jgi:hypothetical protein